MARQPVWACARYGVPALAGRVLPLQEASLSYEILCESTSDRLKPGLVRLRALFDSRVEVPDLADTVRPVSERNCIGAITPGGEQRKENDQAVTPWQSYCHKVNSIRPVLLASVRVQARSPNKILPPAQMEWNAAEGAARVVGDSMVGSQRDVNQGTTAGGDEKACRGQSVRSSEEASNDRGV